MKKILLSLALLTGLVAPVAAQVIPQGAPIQFYGVNSSGSGGGSSVSSFSAGTTGFTPSSPTTGAVVLSGTLGIANGGTGASAAALSVITNLGAITGSPSSTTYLRGDGTWSSAGGVTSIAGTANQITASGSTGAVTLSLPSSVILPGTFGAGATVVTSSSATALTVGANGATNPAFTIDASTASSVTGVSIKSAASGGGVTIASTSSGSIESITLTSKSTAPINIGTGANGAINLKASSTIFTGTPVLDGSLSGSLTLAVPSAAGSNTLTFPAGTTDFSASGGTSQVVKQTSSGGAFTVAQLACGDLSNANAFCSGTSATSLTGTLQAAQEPAHTGDMTNSAGSLTTTVGHVNGVSYGASPSTNTVAVVTGANATTYEAVPNAALANASTTINGQTCTLGSTCTITASAGTITVGSTTIASGTSGHVLFNNGGTLGDEALVFAQTTFSAGGTFTTPANSSTATIYHYRMVGGGGGGAGNGTTDFVYGAPGGGGGEYAEGTFTGVAPSTAITITVGAAGAGGTSSVAGSNGGDSIIGTPVSITAHHGVGGPNVVSGQALGGIGGTGSTAPIAFPGRWGFPSAATAESNAAGGAGGDSGGAWGQGGAFAVSGPNPGNNGTGYGAGGSGGRATGVASETGGSGTAGFVIIERMTP